MRSTLDFQQSVSTELMDKECMRNEKHHVPFAQHAVACNLMSASMWKGDRVASLHGLQSSVMYLPPALYLCGLQSLPEGYQRNFSVVKKGLIVRVASRSRPPPRQHQAQRQGPPSTEGSPSTAAVAGAS